MKRFAMWHPTEGLDIRTLAESEDDAWEVFWSLDVIDVSTEGDYRERKEREGWRVRQVRIVLDDDERPANSAANTDALDRLSRALREGM